MVAGGQVLESNTSTGEVIKVITSTGAAALQAKSLLARGDLKGAGACLATLLQAMPDDAAVLRLAGLAELAAGRYAAALPLLERGGFGESNDAAAQMALARCHEAAHQFDKALQCARRAVDLAPDSADARVHLAGVEAFEHLRNGDLARGFRGLLCKPLASRGNVPAWNGKKVSRLFISTSDQGFGDALQFARYIPRAVERADHVIISADQALVRLFQQSGFRNVIADQGQATAQKSDSQISALLLGSVLGATDYATPPPGRGYLTTTEAPLELGEEFNVGICWAGDPENPLHAERSAPAAAFEPLSAIPGARFYSLMIGARETERPAWMHPLPIEIRDFCDTARAVRGMDLVISVDTGAAHLAGALGIPVWIALSTKACWRWERDPRLTHWYAEARLFRQDEAGGWDPVIDAMRGELVRIKRP